MSEKEKQASIEKQLITNFLDHFYMKMGYYPTVFGKYYKQSSTIKVLELSQLKACFDPFLPKLNGKKLTLHSKQRVRRLTELRFIYAHIAKKMGYTLNLIGHHMGGRDHTTVLHGLRTFRNLYETDEAFRSKYQTILNHIKNKYESSFMDQFNQMEHESE